MDNIRTHFTKDLMKWYLENDVAVIRFPKYSPQLNPIEQYWKNIKQWLGTKPIISFKYLRKTLGKIIKWKDLWPKTYGYKIT